MRPQLLLRRQPQRSLCQLCERIARQPATPAYRRAFLNLAPGRRASPRPQIQQQDARVQLGQRRLKSTERAAPLSAANIAIEVGKAQEAVNAIVNKPDTVPDEDHVLKAMRACESAAKQLMDHDQNMAITKQEADGNTSAGSILHSLNSSPDGVPSNGRELLSSLAYKLVLHPTVFITPEILSSFVTTQFVLQEPEDLPNVLYLYANKPIPKRNASGVQYSTPNPTSPSASVPPAIANLAIDAAIRVKDLTLALSIIEFTFRAPAYRRALLVRKVLPPWIGLCLSPLAAYALARQFGDFQQVTDTASATWVALTGMLTYVGTLAIVGVVAVTTSNDQMDRVTWAPGMALSERWLREEERAAADRIAQAWGFPDPERRGDEDSPDWEELREWAGLRGMILDKVELMEGME